MQTKLLINGALVAGEGESHAVYNPSQGNVLVRITEASGAQVHGAVQSADAAFDAWSQTPPKDRAALLLKLAERIDAQAHVFARLEADNCGKPFNAVLLDELPAVSDVFRFFAGAVRCLQGSAAGEYVAGHTSMIRRDAVGVVASIAPWNYPLLMAAWKLGPALAGGNTVVLKPSEHTPLSTLKLGELLAEIFPAGVVNIVHGRGASVGEPLTSHAQVRMVSLTGSVRTGSRIIEGTAESVKRMHMELGGQGSCTDLRRCRHRRRRRRHPRLRLLQRRPGLYRRVPPLCAERGLPGVRSQARRGRIQHPVRAAGRSGDRDGTADHQGAS